MRKVSEKDWNEFTSQKYTFRILEDILDGQSPNLHFGWIALLYKKYKLGDWENTLPIAESIKDKSYLMWYNEGYCLYHLNHEKIWKTYYRMCRSIRGECFRVF